MSPLAWFLCLSGGFFWFLVVTGVVGSFVLRPRDARPAATTPLRPVRETVASRTVVPLHDPRHDPLTCSECMGSDRGSF